MMDLQENLQQVEANICKACENAGRKRSDVTLIAVSKTKPIEMLQTVYDLGARDFGENKQNSSIRWTVCIWQKKLKNRLQNKM